MQTKSSGSVSFINSKEYYFSDRLFMTVLFSCGLYVVQFPCFSFFVLFFKSEITGLFKSEWACEFGPIIFLCLLVHVSFISGNYCNYNCKHYDMSSIVSGKPLLGCFTRL